MPGLLGYAAAGALAGAGEGIVERAKMIERDAMMKLQRQWQTEDRAQSRQWQVEDRDLAVEQRRQERTQARSWDIEDRDFKIEQGRRATEQFAGLVDAWIQQESGGDPNAVSNKGAVGLTQIMPSTARKPGFGMPDIFTLADREGVSYRNRGEAELQRLLREPDLNRKFGTMYLDKMAERYGSLTKALAAYNAGAGAVDKYKGVPPIKETRNYVRAIITAMGDPYLPAEARSIGSNIVQREMGGSTEYRTLSAEEMAGLGLEGGVYQVSNKTGRVLPVSGTRSNVDVDPADVRSALRAAGIPTPDPEVMDRIIERVKAGEAIEDVIADLDVPEVVTNKPGTVVSRTLGLTDRDAPPDATAKGRPTGFRGAAEAETPPDSRRGLAPTLSYDEIQQALTKARDAIARGADPEAVKQRLLEAGVDPVLLDG